MKRTIGKMRDMLYGPKSRLNTRIVAFIFCVLISVFLWLVSALSKEYTTVVDVPLKYTNMPQDKLPAHSLPGKVEVLVRAKGERLLRLKWFPPVDSLNGNLRYLRSSDTPGTYSLNLSRFTEKLNDEMGNEVRVIRIIPDTLYIGLLKKESRQLPVKLMAEIGFKEHYRLAGKIQITPPKVRVSGPPQLLEKIDSIPTRNLVLKEVDSDILRQVELELPAEYSELELSRRAVKIKAAVGKYAEKEVEVPVKVRNAPSSYQLKIFPETVKVKFLVSFDAYQHTNADDFSALADYAVREGSHIPVKADRRPDGLKEVKVIPSKVEYLLIKNEK